MSQSDFLDSARLDVGYAVAVEKEDGMARTSDDEQKKNSLEEIYLQESEVEEEEFDEDYHINPSISGAPVDYSFRKVYSLSELENGTPRQYRVGLPKKNSSGKFISSSLWANYNHLTDLKSLGSLLNVCLDRPEMIGWLDVSFNSIEFISNEILTLTNLKILYLHGNKIKFFIEVFKLKALEKLRTLTLHGNPIEEQNNYRSLVVKNLPQLKNFDFSVVLRD